MKMTFLTRFEKKICSLLVLVLGVSTAISVFLPQGAYAPSGALPAPKPVVALVAGLGVAIVYGALGLLGLKLASIVGFMNIWDIKVSAKERFLRPTVFGAGLGILFIAVDTALRVMFSFQGFPHPPFPTSIFASLNAGIGEEILFRLFFMSVLMWTFMRLSRGRAAENVLFWIVAALSAIAFSAGHFPAVLLLTNASSIADVPLAIMAEVLILNSVLAFCAAHCFRRYGILAAMGVHFWADIVWHVIYGSLS